MDPVETTTPTEESVPVEQVPADSVDAPAPEVDAPAPEVDASAPEEQDAPVAEVEAPAAEAPAAAEQDAPAAAEQDAPEEQDASVPEETEDGTDGPPKKRSRFGEAAAEADAAPADPLARARAIAERLGSGGGPGKEGEAEESSQSVQVRKKVYMPADPQGKVNYFGILMGPKGQNHKDMEQKSGAKISVRGRGSQKAGSTEKEDDDELHVLIIGDQDQQVRSAEKLVRDVLFDPELTGNSNLGPKQFNVPGAHPSSYTPSTSTPAIADAPGAPPGAPVGGVTALAPPGPPSGAPALGANGMVREEPEARIEVKVMNFIAGAIIGRGGETVRNLQQTSHANIQIHVDESPGADPQQRIVLITGRHENVMHAKSLVEGIVREREAANEQHNRGGGGGGDQRGPPGQGHYGPGQGQGGPGGPGGPGAELRFGIDHSKVGLVIGKQGMTIRAIQEKTQARIQIPTEPDAEHQGLRTVIITASTMQGAEAARSEVHRVIDPDAAMANADPNSFFYIPNDKVGLIIGKGGSVIKSLQMRTNTQIQIPNQPEPNMDPPMRRVSVTGAPRQVDICKEEIQSLVSDDFREGGMRGGGGNFGGQQGGQGGQYGGQQGGGQYGGQQGGGQYGQQQQQPWGGNQQGGGFQQQQHQQQQQQQQQMQNPQQQQQWQQYYAAQAQMQQQQQQQQQPQQHQQQAGGQQQAAAGGGGTQQYTRVEWDAWRQYYQQVGYEMGAYPGEGNASVANVQAAVAAHNQQKQG